MPLDQYSPCPCGSGKKLKFCKCVEQPQDYEKLVRLIEGGQELAAMDRINQMLSKTPNAAWLLALKGELALGMQELEAFKETANRFLKLKPDNPLALIMMSLATSLESQPVETAAQYLLGGLAESRESLPSMTLLALDLLIRSLAASDKISLAGYWGDLQQLLSGNQQNGGESVLQEESLNLICKVPARLAEDPPGAAWKERLAEVISLSRVFCFAQAETKLRAILRDFPGQPGPLSYLLRAQMAQLDQNGAHSTATKLAEHLEIPVNDRAYYAALAYELESDRKSLRPESIEHYCEIDSVERVSDAMAQLDYVQEVGDEIGLQVKQYYAALVGDEVPAKRVYTVFDRAIERPKVQLDSGDQTAQTDKREIASAVSTVVLFGKQTDRPARALFIATRFAPNQARNDEILNLLALGPEIESANNATEVSYVSFVRRPKLVVGRREPPSIEEFGKLAIEGFLHLPFTMFDGATPLEIAGEERFRGKLLGLLCHLEGEQSLVMPADTIGEIYQRLGLERPPARVNTSATNLSITNILDLDRLDLNGLSDDHLQGVLMRAMNLAASRVVYHASLIVLSRESLANNHQSQIIARSALRMIAVSFEEKIEHSRALIQLLSSVNAPVGKIVIELVSLLAASGREKEAQQTIVEALSAHPEDPHLINFMQQIMQSQRGPGASRGANVGDELAGRMRSQSAREEVSSSLVLPGHESSAPQGESKLWLPGS